MEEISKSQKKREAEALQKIGVKLISLSPANLDKLPLTEALRQAIDQAKTIKKHGALRRQEQLIGKLMRQAEHEEICIAFQKLITEEKNQTTVFHLIENWRNRLIHDENEALTEFLQLYHTQDIQKLRQLIKNAKDEKQNPQITGATKALFRFIKSCIETS